MTEIYYTKDHEWIKIDGNVGVVGITAYASEQLGDIVFVELPEDGKIAEIGKDIAVVESCLLYTSPSPRDRTRSRMPSSA